MGSATGTTSLGLNLPPTFPPGVNPETYRLDAVTALLKRAAFFSLFSVPSNIPNVPLPMPGRRSQLRGIEVHENVHYFDIRDERSECNGLKVRNTLGQHAGTVHIHWLPVPDNFEAAPDRTPPPTALDPSRSQRFVMMDGEFRFDDPDRSGFHGFGAGRTFPVMVGNQAQLRIGAVVEILEGIGRLKNQTGNVVVNGYIAPPNGLALNLMVRVMDIKEDLVLRGDPDPIVPMPLTDPEAAFFVFLGERDPDNPITLNTTPDGKVLGAKVHERLRLVHVGFDINSGLRSKLTEGPIVGTLSFLLDFNLFDPRVPFPFLTRQGVFTFFDSNQTTLGTVQADIVEGRAFRTDLQGAPMPVFRMVGFGPLLGGSGEFASATGMLSLNGAISVFPRCPRLFYVFRFHDPGGKLRASLGQGWSQ
jgi:hypothetical protein